MQSIKYYFYLAVYGSIGGFIYSYTLSYAPKDYLVISELYRFYNDLNVKILNLIGNKNLTPITFYT